MVEVVGMQKTCKQLEYWNREGRNKDDSVPQSKSTSVEKVSCFDSVRRLTLSRIC